LAEAQRAADIVGVHWWLPARLRPTIARVCLLFMASYGLLYFSYRNSLPWDGTGDLLHYYPMYLSPLDLRATEAPFVLRQISAVLTHLVFRAHIYMGETIRFVDPEYDQRVFFAALLTNWVCLVLAGAVAGAIAEQILGRKNQLVALVAGFLCLLSFHCQYVVISGITEGPNWLLIALGFLAYLRQAKLPLAAVLVAAIFQRETILIAFCVIAAFDLVRRERDRGFRLAVLGVAATCFGVYLGFRRAIPGREYQMNLAELVDNLAHPHIDRGLIFQGLLTQNIALIAIVAGVAAAGRTAAKVRWLPMMLVTLAVLDLVGVAAAIGNNIGRVGGILTPIFAGLAAAELGRLGATDEMGREVVEAG
jgi:hypothetical protein